VLFCSLFFALGSSGAAEQDAMPNRGALFKVQQGGRTLYLFGTIHVGARNFYPLEPRLSGLLKKAPVLALEIDPLGDPQNWRARCSSMASGQGHHAVAGLAPAAGASAAAVPHRTESVATMKPWLLASLLTVSEFAAQGYEGRWRWMRICRNRRTPGRKSWSWNRPKARWRCSTR
jgi:uncharacterized protein YbaP (TraB family)